MGGKQLGFADYEQSTAKKRTKKEKFLAVMDQVVPWQPLLDLMQQWYSLSDPAMEDALIEVPTIWRFAGIELISDKIPDETTILAIIDATLISAPSSKNKTGERDPEMHQTKKGNQWYHRYAEGFAYGMKFHIGVDKDSGLIHSVETTSANVHDISRAAQLLHGEEEVVYGDAGYQGIEKRAEMAGLARTPDGRLLDLVETALAAGFCLQ